MRITQSMQIFGSPIRQRMLTLLAWNGPTHQSKLLSQRTCVTGCGDLAPLTNLIESGMVARWTVDGGRIILALDPSFPAAAELRELLRQLGSPDETRALLSDDIVPAASLRGMPVTDPSRMHIEKVFSRNGSGDRGRLLMMLEAVGGDAPVLQLRHIVALEVVSGRTILNSLAKRGILVAYTRGKTEYVRFSDHPAVALLRRMLSKLASSSFEYAEARRYLRLRAVQGSGFKRLGQDWLEYAIDPKRSSGWFPKSLDVPPFFGPYARYQMLSLLAERGPLRRSDVVRTLKIAFEASGDFLTREGALLTWRPTGSETYAAIHPKHPARDQLVAFLRAVKAIWPALDPFTSRQPVVGTALAPPASEPWRGNLLLLCGAENRTLALIMARLAGGIDAPGVESLGGYDRATVGNALQIFARGGIMRSRWTSAHSVAYELDTDFGAYAELVALIDAIVAHEPAKWQGRLQRLRSTRRREAFEPAPTTNRRTVAARKRRQLTAEEPRRA